MSLSITTMGEGSPLLDPKRPQPGVYPDVPESVYHGEWDLASSTRLWRLWRTTPAHMRFDVEHPQETRALRVGRLLHTMVLTPALAGQQFAVAPTVDRRTKAGKAAWAEFVASAADKTVVAADEYHALSHAYEAVRRHETATILLHACTQRELSVVVDLKGVRVKVRLDGHGDVAGVIDLKSTSGTATKQEFERAVATLGYGFRAALYRMACRAAGLSCDDFSYIVVEIPTVDDEGRLESHCEARVFRLRDEVMDAYEGPVEEALAKYGECERLNTWPGYPQDVEDVALPTWTARELGMEVFP